LFYPGLISVTSIVSAVKDAISFCQCRIYLEQNENVKRKKEEKEKDLGNRDMEIW
jgi:hypothetical protein